MDDEGQRRNFNRFNYFNAWVYANSPPSGKSYHALLNTGLFSSLQPQRGDGVQPRAPRGTSKPWVTRTQTRGSKPSAPSHAAGSQQLVLRSFSEEWAFATRPATLLRRKHPPPSTDRRPLRPVFNCLGYHIPPACRQGLPMNIGKKPGCHRILPPVANRFMRKPCLSGYPISFGVAMWGLLATI